MKNLITFLLALMFFLATNIFAVEVKMADSENLDAFDKMLSNSVKDNSRDHHANKHKNDNSNRKDRSSNQVKSFINKQVRDSKNELDRTKNDSKQTYNQKDPHLGNENMNQKEPFYQQKTQEKAPLPDPGTVDPHTKQ